MTKVFFCKFLIQCVLSLMMSSAFAQSSESSDIENWYKNHVDKKNRTNFSGWNGIVFICAKGENSEEITQICHRINENISFIAATSRVRLMIAKSYLDFYMNIQMGNLLPLEAIFFFTNKGPPAAISVRLRSGISFSEAIEYKDNRSISGGRNVSPRSGELIFWERTTLGATTGVLNELVSPVSQGVEQLLKIFFTDYLVANK
jgi:hypothetical protein